MISLRHFTEEDLACLRAFYPELSDQELLDLLDSWNAMEHSGHYFEMFAVCQDHEIVGEISLYQHTSDAVSIGPTIYEPYRRRGYGAKAMELAICHAKEKGFRIVIQQVSTSNEASMALHKRLGFEIDGFDYVYMNRKGHPCYLFLKSL